MKRLFPAIAALAACTASLADAQTIRRNPGFSTNSVARNDDGSSAREPLGFTVNLFGKIRNSVYVNNNGNLTFDSALSTFTPFGLRGTEREIIAPFFADVDTRPEASKLVTYGQDLINGRRAFAANYIDVGYYANHTDKTNSFQVVLIERADQSPGDFDLEFNYERIAWETGDASGGENGFGGTPAAVGWSNGSDTSFELPGSLQVGAFLDGGPYSLVRQSITGAVVSTPNSQQNARPGRLIFRARDGVISPGLTISGGQLPDATLGVPYSETVTVAGADPPYRWTLQPDTIAPPGLALSTAGVLSGTPTAAGTYSFTLGVTAESEDGEITVYERGSLTVRPAAVRITTSCPLPDAFAGVAYSRQLTATGAANILWSVREALHLPAGLALSPNGLLAGTPQTPGTFQLILEARAADGNAQPARIDCKLQVQPAAIQLSGGCSLPRATVGVPFSQTLQPGGGFSPYTFQLQGDLPQGVALTGDGRIVGTPGYWGVWIFHIATTDSRGARATQECSMIVDPAAFTTSVCPLPAGTTGTPYSADLTPGFTWSVIGSLPGGLTLNPEGRISGTPMTAGGAHFQLLATDAAGKQSAEACSIVIDRGPLSLFGCPLPQGNVGVPYSSALIPLGGSSPHLFSIATGALPPGLTLAANGSVNGVPTASGDYSFSLRLRDGTQASTIQACRLTIAPAELRLTTPCPLPDGRVGEPYSLTLEAAGGRAPYRFSYGLLPDGLTGNETGTIAGAPARIGGRSFPIRLTDADNRSVETFCSLPVGAPKPTQISIADPPATVAPASTSLALTVQLAEPYTAPVRGTISMAVETETAGNDPTVQSPDPLLAFANGQRTAAFTIPTGAVRASVPVVSTGTVAGRVTVSLGNLEASGAAVLQNPSPKQFRIAPAAPTIASACYTRTNSEQGLVLEARVTGISTTRELTRARFTIPGLALVKSTIPVPPEFVFDATDTVTVDIQHLAFGYYASPLNVRTGGAFTLAVPVPLDRDPNFLPPTAKLDAIPFEIFNTVGGTGVREMRPCP